jgi:class 3 adenylate cyclase
VKLLGDGVMFHFPEVAGGIRCGLDLIGSAEGAGLPAARMGLHLGPVVFRDGDYFGRTVNLAARITDRARPREMLVSAAVVEALAGQTAPPVARFEPVGEAILKGVAAPVSLYRALPAAATPPIER